MNYPMIVSQTQLEEDSETVYRSVHKQRKVAKPTKPSKCSNDGTIVVREHTRQTVKVAKVGKNMSKVTYRKESIDPASFGLIMKIQTEQLAEFKKQKVIGNSERQTTNNWNGFWQAATAVQKRKRKRPNYVWQKKQNEALTKEKNYIKALNDLSRPMPKDI